MTAPIIGIDFDNTVIDYGELFARLAAEAGLFDPPFAGDRLALREALRARPGGEAAWQRLQATAYGPRIGEAKLSDGVLELIDRALAAGASVHIVSHKTERAAAAPRGPSLPDAALDFMRQHGIIAPGRLERDSVWFAATRADKLARIEALGCTHFVDDLAEVLLDEDFPRRTKKILFAASAAGAGPGGRTDLPATNDWKQVWTLIVE